MAYMRFKRGGGNYYQGEGGLAEKLGLRSFAFGSASIEHDLGLGFWQG